MPTHEVVSDFVDVVTLFLQATRVHIADSQCELRFWNDAHAELHILRISSGLQVRPSGTLKNEPAFDVPSTNEADYVQLLKAIVQCVGPR